ncbi:CocE/NonD family hydrolase [Cohnella thermotolerans]|uniref:CocE/NonD family hydrolase n=1 Tax=Cohnella thermotolerans TaxID=329858 RepID=UPI0004068DAE|nr:CocE/NonD family hydrolase [Cohnella thermotolerans]
MNTPASTPPPEADAASGTDPANLIVERDVPVPMRDGTVLKADIYRPAGTARHPVLLMRTPYNKEDAQTMNYAHPTWYAARGYVVVVQDTRGRWASEGEFRPYATEGTDGYDTVEWAAALPYALPRVGMYGFSYVAAVQWLAALERPPHLACLSPGMIGADAYQGPAYRNGAFALASTLSWALFVGQDAALRQGRLDWVAEINRSYAGIHGLYKHLPLKSVPGVKPELLPFYAETLDHPTRDDFWHGQSLRELYDRIEVPVLHLAGWYDLFLDGTIENFLGVRSKGATAAARDHQYLIVEPWYHMPWSRYVGDLDFGTEAANRIDEIQLRWFDRWLKGDEARWRDEPPVRYFLMGDNRWEQAQQWPPPEAVETRFYFHSASKANSINGDGSLSVRSPERESPDVYVYHPSIPVPALGGRSGAVPDLTPMGPRNQLPIEVRNDVLVYTSEVLAQEVKVVGDIRVVLYASTTAEDTDWVAKLVDVHPGGAAYNVAEGIVRASYRHSLERREPVTPGEVVRYEIPLGSTAIVFKPGHAIRVDVTSSLFPTYDRHPNRIVPPGEATEADFATATQTIHHDARYPSHIVLPVVQAT